MKYLGIALLCVLALIFILASVCIIKALLSKKTLPEKKSVIGFSPEEAQSYAQKLSEMIKVPTVSKKRGENYDDFLKFQEKLQELFPLIFSTLEVHDIEGNMLRRWKGKNPCAAAVLLMGHQDVVPVNQSDWKYEPFSGVIEDGVIFGRGAMDCKSTLCCELSAVEELLGEGFVPESDIWLFSSVNEENSGGGAQQAVEYLKNKGVKLSVVLDEGGAVIDNVFPGLSSPCAAIGIVEKGFCDIKFIARGAGGHSSTPPKNTPIARLAKFVAEVEKAPPFVVEMSKPVEQMFDSITPYLSFPMRIALANRWLFSGVLKSVLSKMSGMTRAFVASTAAFTMCEGSNAANVIPDAAYVVCNIRPSVHQNSASCVEALKKIADKYDIETQLLYSRDASNAASPEGAEFNYLKNCVSDCMPDVVVIPYLMAGGTDCRYFEDICDNCLRFTPTRLSSRQLAAMHAANENIGVNALAEGVKVYKYFLQNRKNANL